MPKDKNKNSYERKKFYYDLLYQKIVYNNSKDYTDNLLNEAKNKLNQLLKEIKYVNNDGLNEISKAEIINIDNINKKLKNNNNESENLKLLEEVTVNKQQSLLKSVSNQKSVFNNLIKSPNEKETQEQNNLILI